MTENVTCILLDLCYEDTDWFFQFHLFINILFHKWTTRSLSICQLMDVSVVSISDSCKYSNNECRWADRSAIVWRHLWLLAQEWYSWIMWQIYFWISEKLPHWFLHRNWKKNLKFCMERQKMQERQNNPENKKY